MATIIIIIIEKRCTNDNKLSFNIYGSMMKNKKIQQREVLIAKELVPHRQVVCT